MKVEIKIQSELEPNKIILTTRELNDDIQKIVHTIENKRNTLTAYNEQRIYRIALEDIYYIYSEQQKIYIKTKNESYLVKYKLYELEEQLRSNDFLRIANGLLANMKLIKNLEMSFNGTMCIYFKNGDVQYSSRRFVSKIKEYLEI